MDIYKLDTENELEYIVRLYEGMISGDYDIDYIELFELGFHKTLSITEARKRSYTIGMLLPILKQALIVESSNNLKMIDFGVVADNNTTLNETITDDSDELYIKAKSRIQQRDERNLMNEYVRKASRLDRYKDLIEDAADKMAKEKPCLFSNEETVFTSYDKVGILQLSDHHYGLQIDNAWNKYDVDIYRTRLEKVINETISRLYSNGINKLYVLIQGDLISSSIRSVIRLKNQEDIIEQIMNVSEYLFDAIDKLSYYADVKVVVVSGNHDRVTPKKDDSLPQENYVRIIRWYLESRFKLNNKVEFLNNEYGYQIGTFSEFGMNIGVVHGHNDPFEAIVNRISTFTRRPYDLIFTAHRHTANFKDIQKCRVIGNAALVGTDDYCEDLRATSYTGQNFSILYSNKEVSFFPIISE